MDFIEINVKEEALEIEDSKEDYLKPDFEIGVKVENDSPTFEDWCLENSTYQESIECDVVKQEYDTQTCFICLKAFADRYSLYKHNLNHLAVVLKVKRLYQCHHCHCYCSSKAKISKHIHSKHFLLFTKKDVSVTVKTHKCMICQKQFTYRNWHSHMREVHCTDIIQCRDCNVTFKCIRYLRRHLLYKHENVRPSWRFHKVVNTSQKFKCALCPSTLSNKNSLKTHMRNCHSGGVNECSICHSRLKSRSYLLTHMKRVHYDDGKSHECDICRKVFKSPRYLNIHKKNTHGAKVINKKIDKRRKIYHVDGNNLTLLMTE